VAAVPIVSQTKKKKKKKKEKKNLLPRQGEVFWCKGK
jgi:hypothetical protein